MDGGPRLPDRPLPKRKQAGENENNVNAMHTDPPQLAASIDVVRQRMQDLIDNPNVSLLMQDPQTLQRAISSDPRLQELVSMNPRIGEMLKPERMAQMLEAVKDPSKMAAMQGVVGSDLTQQRMVRQM